MNNICFIISKLEKLKYKAWSLNPNFELQFKDKTIFAKFCIKLTIAEKNWKVKSIYNYYT